jgi:hypothetical protein
MLKLRVLELRLLVEVVGLVNCEIRVVVVLLQQVCPAKLKHNKKGKKLG